MKVLADKFLSSKAIDDAGLLDSQGVEALFAVHENPDTSTATQVQLDAVINHMLSVQMMHAQFVAADIPTQARQTADRLGWTI